MGIVEDRRSLHRIPELDNRLPQTMTYLKSALAGLACQVFSPTPSSLAAFFDFGRESAIAFRCDCDALPIQEATSHDFPSLHPGQMHACGHDGHMAIALELARRISGKENLPNNVLLIFQPAEETIGGAKPICDSGVFQTYHVKAIFGLHLWPGLTKGKLFSRENEMMSRSAEVTVDVYGKSAHIGRAWEGNDALAAAVAFYTRVTELERSLPAETFRLLKFGKLLSGQARNAISDHSHLEGSLRAFQDDVFDFLADGIREIAKETGGQFGCQFQVSFSDGYPPIVNPPALCRTVQRLAPFEPLEQPSIVTEDFSWYQRTVPGMFFFLGLGENPALHSPCFDFDESVLTVGADYFETIAEGFPESWICHE